MHSIGKRAVISGISAYVPEDILSNHDLEQRLNTSDEWITERTGIKQRRILPSDKPTSYIGIRAVQDLLQKSNTNPQEIDLIICGTNTPDVTAPATAIKVAYETGCKRAAAFDIQAACPAFTYALVIGCQFIQTNYYQKIIILGIDKMSSVVDYEDRSTAVLFGDGGGAALIEPTEETNIGFLDSRVYSNGIGIDNIKIPAGGSSLPFNENTLSNKEHLFKQNGKAVFKDAVQCMSDACLEVISRNGLTPNDIDYFIPHQANLRIIDAIKRRLDIDASKIIINIQNYGNTSAGTIPICLWENEKKFKKGDKLILTSFGAGYTWSALYLVWAYDSPN